MESSQERDIADDCIVGVEIIDDERTALVFQRVAGARATRKLSAGAIRYVSNTELARHADVTAAAELEVRQGDGYRYVLRARPGVGGSQLDEALDTAAREVASTEPLDDLVLRPDPVRDWMVESGHRLFVGLDDEQMRVAALHITIRQTDPAKHCCDERHASNQVAGLHLHTVHTSTSVTVEPGPGEAERALWKRLFESVREADPDVIVADDLGLICDFAARAGVDFLRGIACADDHDDGRGGGRHVIDIADVIARGAQSGSDLEAEDAPEMVAAELGLPSAIPASPQSVATDATWRARAEMYADMLGALFDAVGRPWFEVCRRSPVELADVLGPYSGDRAARGVFRADFAARRLALPPVSAEMSPVRGGLKELRRVGYFANVLEFDISAAYPSIIQHEGVRAAWDPDPPVLTGVVEELLRARKAHPQSKQALKLLSNKIFGVLAARRPRLFRDRNAAANVTAHCRSLVQRLDETLECEGAEVNRIATDGVLVAIPEHTDVDALSKRVREEMGPYEIRCLGPFRALVIGMDSYVLADHRGAIARSRGSLRFRALPPFIARSLTHVATAVLDEQLDVAVSTLTDHLRQITERRVPVEELATWHSPTYCIDEYELLIDSGELAPLPAMEACRRSPTREQIPAGHEFQTYVSQRPHRGVPGAEYYRLVADAPPDPDYDVDLYASLLRERAWQMLATVADADQLTDSLENPGSSAVPLEPSSHEVRRTGGARVWRALVAGLKTQSKREDERWHVGDDRAAVGAYLAEHDSSDCHQLLLGVRSHSEPHRHELPFRVRLGDFYLEIEHKTEHQAVLPVVKALLATLLDLGCDRDDLRITFNGYASFLVRVRQSALGVEDSVELPEIYRVAADVMMKRVAEDLANVEAPYSSLSMHDAELYRAGATYRLEGVRHEVTGSFATSASVDKVRAAASLDDLRVGPDGWVPPTPWSTDEPAPIARWFERETAQISRNRSYDPNRGVSRKTIERHVAKSQQHRRRLKVLGHDPVIPPCVEKVIVKVEAGESIGFVAAAKAAFELRQLGWARAQVAELFASGAGGPRRYERRVVFAPDGSVDLHDDLWRNPPYFFGCESGEIRPLCDFQSCYRAGTVGGLDESASPSFGEYTVQTRQEVADVISKLSGPGIGVGEVNPRSGKTYASMKAAQFRAAKGERVLFLGSEHAGLQAAVDHVAAQRRDNVVPKVARLVHLMGRRPDSCDEPQRKSCTGCPKALSSPESGQNPLVTELKRRKNKGVFDRAKTAATARDYRLCTYTTTRALAEDADIVLATHAHLLAPGFIDKLQGTRRFDQIYVDEADQLLDSVLGAATYRLPLLRVRLEKLRLLPDRVDCKEKCDECHLAFPTRVAADGVPLPRQDAVRVGDQDPHNTVHLLDIGLDVLRGDPEIAPGFDLAMLVKNVANLSLALPHPKRVAPKGDAAPLRYLEHLSRRALELTSESEALAEASSSGHLLRLRFHPCIDPTARRIPLERDPAVAHRRDTPRYRELIDAERLDALSPDQANAVELLVRFADFADHAARRSTGAVLVPLPRPPGRPDVRSSCGLELQFVDSESVNAARSILEASSSVLLSGSVLDHEMASHALLSRTPLQHEVGGVPMHEGLTVVMHSVLGHSRDPSRPRRLDCEDVPALLERLIQHVELTAAPFEVLVFGKSKKHQKDLCEALAVAPSLRDRATIRAVKYEGGRAVEHDVQVVDDPILRVDVDYLRSPGSRAVDRTDCDVVIVHGSGMPHLDALHAPTEEINVVTGSRYEVTDLAAYSRNRAVLQAICRPVSDPKRRRVALVINEMVPIDLPPWLHHRVVSAADRYADVAGKNREDIVPRQLDRLAAEVAAHLGRPGLKPAHGTFRLTRPQIIAWDGAGSQRRTTATEKALAHILHSIHEDGFVRRSDGTGNGTRWARFIDWLVENGVLELAPGKGRGKAYTLVSDYAGLR